MYTIILIKGKYVESTDKNKKYYQKKTKTDDDAIIASSLDKSNTMKKEHVKLKICAVNLYIPVVMRLVNIIFLHTILQKSTIFIFDKNFALWDRRGLKLYIWFENSVFVF